MVDLEAVITAPTPPPAVEDDELAATAALIKKLRDELAAERTLRQSTEVDLAALVEELEQLRASLIVPAVEFDIIRDASAAQLQAAYLGGWVNEHLQFNEQGDLNVVLRRPVKPAPLAGDRSAVITEPSANQTFPIARALRRDGLAAVEATMDEQLYEVGRAAYESRIAMLPRPAFTRLPPRTGRMQQ